MKTTHKNPQTCRGKETQRRKLAQVNAGGGVNISAGRDASVTTALKGSSYDYNRVTTTRNGIFGKQTRTITTRETDLTNTASNINAGAGANINAGRDLTLQGTNINAAGINLSAGNNVNVLAAYDIKEKTDINSLKSNFKGGSTTNIELDKKAMVSNLNGNTGAVNITAGNAITLEGTLITGASFTPIAQKTNLLAAMDTKTTEHSKTSNNLVWQTSQSKGTTNQVMHLTNINVPVGMSNFKGAGGITVQLPKNASLTEQITSLAKQPGNEYLTDLAKRSDIDWQRVEVINKSWDYKKEGLTPAASIVIAIVVAIATAGAASSAAGSLVGTTTVAVPATATAAATTTTVLTGTGLAASAGMSLGVATATTAAVTAGITALATSATLAIINNKGDIGAALKELGSKENIKSLVTAMATAGLVQGLGAALNLPSTGIGSSFIDKLQTNLVNGIASSLITTAINGGSVEDALKNAVKGAVINSIAAQGANGIGDLTRDGKLDQTALENFANKFAHAVLGCATGAATANSQAGCAAGAVGALAGGLGAELYDPKNVKGVDAQQFGKLTASLAVLLAGGDAKLVNVAGATAVNAIANNRQLHPNERKLAADLAAKSGGKYTVKQIEDAMRNSGNAKYGEDITAGMIVDPNNSNAIYDKGAVWNKGDDGKLVQVLPNNSKVDANLAEFIQANTSTGSNSPYSWTDVQVGKIVSPVTLPKNNSITAAANGCITAECAANISGGKAKDGVSGSFGVGLYKGVGGEIELDIDRGDIVGGKIGVGVGYGGHLSGTTVSGALLQGPVGGYKAPALVETNPQQPGEVRIGSSVTVGGGVGTVGVEGSLSRGVSVTDTGNSSYTNGAVNPTASPVIPKFGAEIKVNLIEIIVKPPEPTVSTPSVVGGTK